MDLASRDQRVEVDPNSEMAPYNEFEQMTESLIELGRKLGFS